VPTSALLARDKVLTADGRFGIVQAVELARRPQLMYNLTVAEAHTFVVGSARLLPPSKRGKSARGFIPQVKTGLVVKMSTLLYNRDVIVDRPM
jgi:hypothetical protein